MEFGGGPISAGMKVKIVAKYYGKPQQQQLPDAGRSGMVGDGEPAKMTRFASALNKTAGPSRGGERMLRTAPPIHDEINIEGDADAEQQRQRDDVAKFKA